MEFDVPGGRVKKKPLQTRKVEVSNRAAVKVI
jgi:hypothetical protein